METLLGIVLILFGIYFYYRQKYDFWRARNVKTPTPVPVLGNLLSFLLNPKQSLSLKWTREYGKMHGYYLGTKPFLVCADVNVLKQICIKDFDKFPNHYHLVVKNKYQKHFLTIQRDDHWRRMRALITPTFTSSKIKFMYRLLSGCSDDLVKQQGDTLKTRDVSVIDTRSTFGAFAMVSALCSFYGINLNRMKPSGEKSQQKYTQEEFAKRSKEALEMTPMRFIMSSLVPESILNFFKIYDIREAPFEFFFQTATKIINQRTKAGQRHDDYLQILLDAKEGKGIDNQYESDELSSHESHHTLMINSNNGQTAKKASKMSLTEAEVSSQITILLVVATETTSTLLSNTIYLLAHHPLVQERLYRELLKIQKTNEDQTKSFDYEQITSCIYLDCVISESLRIMPPTLRMDRQANDDYFIDDYNIKVPKGTIVSLDFYSILNDPDYWPQPSVFNPDRFLPENKSKIVPGSYCPFGIGPRACVAFRFALTEAKVGIAKFVSEFEIGKVKGTKYPPESKTVTFVVNESKDMLVSIKKR